jgi:hypothetical protein
MNIEKLSAYYATLCEKAAQVETQIEFLSLIDLPPVGVACLVATNNTVYAFTNKGCEPIDRDINNDCTIVFHGRIISVKGYNFNTTIPNIWFHSHDLKLIAGCFTIANDTKDNTPQPKTT